MLDTQDSQQHEALMTLEVKPQITRNPDSVNFCLNKTLLSPGKGLAFRVRNTPKTTLWRASCLKSAA